ncbi:MAG: hypothetical protein Q8J74_02415 [Candidatus Didemnitutus sp.]|nr:hypothetical protein [Candidatus Didemnitutus sp.]
MKTLLLAIAAILLSSCAAPPPPARPAYNPRAPHSSFFSKLPRPASGTFNITYIPAHFTEPDDIREARHRRIKLIMILKLEKAGLKFDPTGISDYDISYHYTTGPAILESGFSHSFNILVLNSKNRKGFDEDRVWDGSVSVNGWPDRDIAYLFPSFIDELLENFPKNQNDRKAKRWGQAL